MLVAVIACALVLQCVCCIAGCPSVVMKILIFTAGLAVTNQQYTTVGFVPPRVLGPFAEGEQYIHIVYECNGHERDHDAPLDLDRVTHLITLNLRRGTLTACLA